jgi:tetratricopeptide (TPR) repeat protein
MRAPLVTMVLLVSAIVMDAPGHSGAQQPLLPSPTTTLTLGDVGAPSAVSTGRAAIDDAIRARDWGRAERLLAAEIEHPSSNIDRTTSATNSAELLKTFARICLIDHRPLNAAVAIKKAEALGAIDDETRFALALAYVSLQRADWARPELERLVTSQPSNVTFQYWLGRLDYDAGQYASAIKRFEDVVRRDPQFVRAHDNLGLCYEAQNQQDKALVHYREAVRLNRLAAPPNRSPWPPLNLGVLLRHRGARQELEEGEGLLKEAISYQPQGLAQAYYELGMLLDQRERVSEAITALANAVKADPTYPEPHYALSRIYRRAGRVEQADEAMATFRRLRAARDARDARAREAAAAVDTRERALQAGEKRP